MVEKVNPEAMRLALLESMQKNLVALNTKMVEMKSELTTIRKGQEKTNVHLLFKVNLATERTDKELADLIKMGFDASSIYIAPVPSAISVKLRGKTDEDLDLEKDECISLSNHVITRILVTNTAGTGTAKIHLYGRWKSVD